MTFFWTQSAAGTDDPNVIGAGVVRSHVRKCDADTNCIFFESGESHLSVPSSEFFLHLPGRIRIRVGESIFFF